MGAYEWVMYFIDSVTFKCFDRKPKLSQSFTEKERKCDEFDV